MTSASRIGSRCRVSTRTRRVASGARASASRSARDAVRWFIPTTRRCIGELHHPNARDRSRRDSQSKANRRRPSAVRRLFRLSTGGREQSRGTRRQKEMAGGPRVGPACRQPLLVRHGAGVSTIRATVATAARRRRASSAQRRPRPITAKVDGRYEHDAGVKAVEGSLRQDRGPASIRVKQDDE